MRRRLLQNNILLPDFDFNGHDFVDMGDAGYWATCNIGAQNPVEDGLLFAFASISGVESSKVIAGLSSGNTFELVKAPYYLSGTTDSKSKWSKYVINASYGSVDNKLTLDLDDDAAHIVMGGDWLIPSESDFQNLINLCNTEWIENYNGSSINGRLFSLKDDPSKRIFFGAFGYQSAVKNTELNSIVCYRSASVSSLTYSARELYADKKDCFTNGHSRYYGLPVRAFIPKPVQPVS